MARLPRHVVIDGFLPVELHDAVLAKTLGQEKAFKRSTMREDGADVHGEARKSWVNEAELGELEAPFEEAVRAALPAIFGGLGIQPFEPAKIELEVSAHRDGDFYRPHVDTFHSEDRAGRKTDRVVTAGHDAPIEPQTLLYYHRCGLIAESALRPFDARRDGSLLGEGSGALVLESEASALARGARPLGEYLGGGDASEGEGLLTLREDGGRGRGSSNGSR